MLEGIPRDFQGMVNTNASAKIHSGQAVELDYRKMQEIMATMPTYNEMLRHYTQHMKLIDQIWRKFERRGLKELAELEQCLATGVTKDGHQTDSSTLLNEVYLMLQSKLIKDEDRQRLALVALLTVQMPEQDRRKLAGSEKVLKKLAEIGLAATSSKITKNVDKQTREMAKLKLSQMTMDLQRHTPVVERLVDEFRCSPNKFEVLGVHGAYEKQAEKHGRLGLEQKAAGDVLVVFFLGGVVPAEVCSLHRKKVLVGTTELMDSNSFLKKFIS